MPVVEEPVLQLGSISENVPCAVGTFALEIRAALPPSAEPEQQRLQAVLRRARVRASDLCSSLRAALPARLPRRKCKLSSNAAASERSQGTRSLSEGSISAESLGVPGCLLPT